jgi:hypothetical protein
MTINSLNNQCLSDFTVTSDTNGVTRSIVCSNTTNAANSAATILAQVAGGTAADAKHQASINGGQVWSWGLDNSDSDAFALSSNASLGTTNVIRVKPTTGEVNLPLQPAFNAYLSATQNNKTGAGTDYTIIFDTELYDIGNNYNNGTGTFTAPVTGIYRFSAGVLATGCTIANICYLGLIHSGGNSKYTFVSRAAASYDFDLTISSDIKLTAAETVSVIVSVSGEAGNTVDIGGAASFTWFCGSLIC